MEWVWRNESSFWTSWRALLKVDTKNSLLEGIFWWLRDRDSNPGPTGYIYRKLSLTHGLYHHPSLTRGGCEALRARVLRALLPEGIVSEPSDQIAPEGLAADCPCAWRACGFPAIHLMFNRAFTRRLLIGKCSQPVALPLSYLGMPHYYIRIT